MVEIKPFGEEALIISLETEISVSVHLKVKAIFLELQKKSTKGIIGLIPAYQSITVIFNPSVTNYDQLVAIIQIVINNLSLNTPKEKKVIAIPVCYELGLDLKEVENLTAFTTKAIIQLHTAKDYLVYFSGFVPGFLYLGGLNEKLRVPRKQTPRTKIPAGAVGLADLQTGIYPLETPGGWQIIGQTPIDMVNLLFKCPVEIGCFIRFYSVSKAEFLYFKNLKNFLPSITSEPWLK